MPTKPDSPEESLKALKQKIENTTPEEEKRHKTAQGQSGAQSEQAKNLSIASRACAELVLSIIVCGFLGYQGDQFFESKPLFLIIGLILGTAVGFLSVYRITNNMGLSVGYKPDQKD